MKKITLLFFTLLVVNGVNAQNVSGVFANNGSVNIVDGTEGTAFKVSGNHTMEAWVKAPDTERGYVMCMGTSNTFRGAYRIETRFSGGTTPSKKARVGYDPANSGTSFFYVTTTSDVFDGTWHHIAIVGTTTGGITSTKIYVDGILDAATVPDYTRPTIWDNNPGNGGSMVYSTVGGRGNPSPEVTADVYFNGEIDEARFWTVARTQTQIQNESWVIVDATGLYRHLKLDNNILDSSVNAKPTVAVGAGVSSYATLGVKSDTLLEQSLQIYPNPNKGQFTLNYNGTETLKKLELYSVTGQLVKVVPLEDFSNQKEITVPELQTGLYLLKIKTENADATKKILIE
jgi:hypothetical protein